jgi:hypothetical protein
MWSRLASRLRASLHRQPRSHRPTQRTRHLGVTADRVYVDHGLTGTIGPDCDGLWPPAVRANVRATRWSSPNSTDSPNRCPTHERSPTNSPHTRSCSNWADQSTTPRPDRQARVQRVGDGGRVRSRLDPGEDSRGSEGGQGKRPAPREQPYSPHAKKPISSACTGPANTPSGSSRSVPRHPLDDLPGDSASRRSRTRSLLNRSGERRF